MSKEEEIETTDTTTVDFINFNILKCEHCDEKFNTKINLFQHLQIHHKIFACSAATCKKYFHKIDDLNEHRLNEHQIPKCPICKNLCESKCLKTHLIKKHKNITSITCEECGLWFESKYRFTKHYKQLHELIELCTCDYCGGV